jgi:hypothetical protein
MEKYMLINRKKRSNFSGAASGNGTEYKSAMEKWIHSLKASGKYISGVSVADMGQNVGADKMIESRSSGAANDNILRIDTILAEDVNQASMIARECPMVTQGLAEIEVRMIVPLIR